MGCGGCLCLPAALPVVDIYEMICRTPCFPRWGGALWLREPWGVAVTVHPLIPSALTRMC